MVLAADDRTKEAFRAVQQSLGGLETMVNRLHVGFAGLLGGLSVTEIARQADAFNGLQARIKTATKATGDYERVSNQLFQTSKQTGTALADTVSIFQNLIRSSEELGATSDDILTLTRTVQQLGVIGGASATGLSAGLLQFSQALMAGTVRAEEFNSILENIPEVATRIAHGMGMNVGQLRKMVLEGKLLSQDVFRALMKQSGEINEEFSALPLRLNLAGTALENSAGRFISKLDEALGLSASMAENLQKAANFLDGMSSEAGSGGLDSQLSRLKEMRAEVERSMQEIASPSRSGEHVLKGMLEIFRQRLEGEITTAGRFARLKRKYADLTVEIDALVRRIQTPPSAPPVNQHAAEDARALEVKKAFLATLQNELELLNYSDQELAVQIQLRKAHAKGILDQDQAIRGLVSAIHAQKRAQEELAEFVRASEAATARQRDIQEMAIETRQRFMDSLRGEVELLKFSGKELAVQTRLREAHAQGIRDQDAAIREMTEAIYEKTRASKEMVEQEVEGYQGAAKAFLDYSDEVGDDLRNMEIMAGNTMRSLEDMLVRAAETGKFSFRDMAASILSDLARLQVRKLTSSLSEGLFGMFNAIPLPAPMPTPAPLPRFHSGGILGGAPFPAGGLGPDEVPFIGRRGEGVFTPQQMAHMAPGPVNFSVAIDIDARGAESGVEQKIVAGMDAAIQRMKGDVIRDFASNGPMARAARAAR